MMLATAIDYSVFPAINASLNSLSTVLLLAGFFLIKAGRRSAHQKVMTAALVSSAAFLACYLFYHYGVGHSEFPREYPIARTIYLIILVPHIILAVINVPLIIALVVFAIRGRFQKHKKLARFVFPSWLFVSVTGVVIYLMLYVWFPPTTESESADPPAAVDRTEIQSGDLVFFPARQSREAKAEQKQLPVEFFVRNDGTEEVRITELTSGCHCLSVLVDRFKIPPGGEATITGVFDLAELHGVSERKILVKTDQGPNQIPLITRIEAELLYTLEPEMTSWQKGAVPDSRRVEFRVLRDRPIHILAADSKRKEVACELIEIEAGRAYDLRLTPESVDQPMLGIVRIETDCEVEQYARPLAYFSVQ